MENATKALIIAGAILITLLVISLGVYIFRNYSDTVESEANMDEQEMAAFNNQILGYLGDNVSGSQVNALIQTVRSINQTAITDGTSKKISISGAVGLGTDNNFTTTNTTVETAGKFYKVNATYTDGLISSITITQN